MDIDLIEKIGRKLITRKKSLAIAESVTAGYIQASVTRAQDAGQFFQGGITVYNPGQKSRHLDIDPIHALECKSVSAEIAANLAINVSRLFLSDYGLGITGFARLVPEDDINELFAYISVSKNGKVLETKKVKGGKGTLVSVQLHYTDEAFKLLHRNIS